MKQRKIPHKDDRTINELLGIIPDDFVIYNSYLVKRCLELCNIPISALGVEDYRILINQGIGLKYIVPLAVQLLLDNLFTEGDFYEGDLLKSVLMIDQSFWQEYSVLREELKQVLLEKFDTIKTLDLSNEIKENLTELAEKFLSVKNDI